MRASNDCIECCCLIPTFCISILVLVFGSLLIAQVTDPANEFFVNDIYAAPGHRYADIWADSEQCFVILHPKSFRGDQLLLYKVNAESETLEMGYTYDVSLDDNVVPGEVDDEINTAIDDTQDETGFGGDVGDVDTSDIVGNVSLGFQIDTVPTDINIQLLEVMKADTFGLVIERNSRVRTPRLSELRKSSGYLSNVTVFRKETDGLPPLSFPYCTNRGYWCANTSVILENGGSTNGSGWTPDGSVSSELCLFPPASLEEQMAAFQPVDGLHLDMAAMIFFLADWLIIRFFGAVAHFRKQTEDKNGAQKWAGKAGVFFAFNFVPPLIIAPLTSLAVHDECPQLATVSFKYTWMYIGLGAGNLVLAPMMAFNDLLPEKAAIVFFAAYFVVFVLGCGWYAADLGTAIADFELPRLPMDFRRLFVFSWPEYSMAWSSDWFRAFAFIMWLLDWVGGPGKALFKRVMGVQVEPA